MVIQFGFPFLVPSESLDGGNDNSNGVVGALLDDVVLDNRQTLGRFHDVSLGDPTVAVLEFAIQTVAGELKFDLLADFFHRGSMIAHVGIARNLHFVQIRMAHAQLSAGQAGHVLVLDHDLRIALETQVLVRDAYRRFITGRAETLVADFVPWKAS